MVLPLMKGITVHRTEEASLYSPLREKEVSQYKSLARLSDFKQKALKEERNRCVANKLPSDFDVNSKLLQGREAGSRKSVS